MPNIELLQVVTADGRKPFVNIALVREIDPTMSRDGVVLRFASDDTVLVVHPGREALAKFFTQYEARLPT